MTDPLTSFPAFVAAVRARLEAGRVAYGDRSFERAPAELLGEVEQELYDVCGWSYVAWERIRTLREQARALLSARAETLPASSPPSLPMAGVRVRPLVAECDDRLRRVYHALDPIVLSRVPIAGEVVRLGEQHYQVVGVTHLVGGDVAAELQLQTLPTPKTEIRAEGT